MNDIAKMRKEFDEKIRYAELENDVETRLGIEGFRIINQSITQRKGLLHTHFFNKLEKEQIVKVLKEFPPTEKYKVSGKDIELTYLLKTHRYPTEQNTVLSIAWISGDFDMQVDMNINESDDLLMQYFRPDWYEIDNHDIGLFYGAVSPRQKSMLKRQRFLSFNSGNVLRYVGGYRYQVSEGHATALVSELIGE
ncbi:MAG: hypothetical protein E7108_01810 [Bacteroidales bacterium]|nr:hypothetical protein [Bacteroidales bacterium]